MSTLYENLKERGISASALARTLGVDKSQLSRWNKRGIPPLRVPNVAAATGIPLHVLHPKLFPAPQELPQVWSAQQD